MCHLTVEYIYIYKFIFPLVADVKHGKSQLKETRTRTTSTTITSRSTTAHEITKQTHVQSENGKRKRRKKNLQTKN